MPDPKPSSTLPTADAAPPRAHLLPFLALLGGNVALAFGPWLVRLADVGPVASAFWRLTLAAPVLLLLLGRQGGGGKGGAAFAPALIGVSVLGGLLFAADLGAWHVGILHTRLANATLFGNTAAFFFPVYGFVMARTWPGRVQALALALAAAGVALLLGRSWQVSHATLVGDALCLLAGLFYTGYFIAMERGRALLGPMGTLLLSTLAGILPLLLFANLLGEAVWPHDWTPLVLLALGSQVVGQGLLIYAIGHLSPLVMGLGLLLQPVVTATIGWAAYGERLDTPDLAGAGMIAAALVLVRVKR